MSKEKNIAFKETIIASLKLPTTPFYKTQKKVFIISIIILVILLIYIFLSKRFHLFIAIFPLIFIIARYFTIHRQRYFEEIKVVNEHITLSNIDIQNTLQELGISEFSEQNGIVSIQKKRKNTVELWTLFAYQNKIFINARFTNYPLAMRINFTEYQEFKHNLTAIINNKYINHKN